MRARNWPLWLGLLLSAAAFVSYFLFFARFPITRDVPWVNALLFIAAGALLILGVVRAKSKILAGIVAMIGMGIGVMFVLAVTIGTRQLPAAAGAPQIGQAAPRFTLLDVQRHAVSLDQLLASAPRGVLLVFYRGFW